VDDNGDAHRGMAIRIEIKLRPTRQSDIQRRRVERSDGRSTRDHIRERGILVTARDVGRPAASAWAWAGDGDVSVSLVHIGSAERCDVVVSIGIVPRRDDRVQDVGGVLDAHGLDEKKGEYDQRA